MFVLNHEVLHKFNKLIGFVMFIYTSKINSDRKLKIGLTPFSAEVFTVISKLKLLVGTLSEMEPWAYE